MHAASEEERTKRWALASPFLNFPRNSLRVNKKKEVSIVLFVCWSVDKTEGPQRPKLLNNYNELRQMIPARQAEITFV